MQRNGRISGSVYSQDMDSLFSRRIDMLAGFHRTGPWIRLLPQKEIAYKWSFPTLTRRWTHAKQPLLRGTPTITSASPGCVMFMYE